MRMSMSSRALFGGLVWVAVGIMLVVRGIHPHFPRALDRSTSTAWMLLALGLVVGAVKGWFVIRRSATRMVARIETQPGDAPFWQIYPPIFLILLPLMIGMGVAVRYFFQDERPGIVTAVYVGIGAALLASSLPFFKAWKRLAA